MTTEYVQQNTNEKIVAYFIDTSGQALSGLNPSLAIRRASDGLYWNGTIFATAFAQVAMTAMNPTNQGGFYSYDFDTTGLNDNNYIVIASGTAAANSPQYGELKVGGWVDNINKPISLIGEPQAGPVINLRGVFTKREKEQLIRIIGENFKQLFELVRILLNELGNVAGLVSTTGDRNEQKVEELKKRIDDINEQLELSTKLIKLIDDENTLRGEIRDE